MRPLGPAEGPSLFKNAGSGMKARAGVFISPFKEGKPGAAFTRLSPAAFARLSPVPGTRHPALIGLKAAVAAARMSQDAARDLLEGFGLPFDSASRLALGALLAGAQKPTPEALKRVRLVILRSPPGEAGDRATLAASLESKGLSATEEAVESLRKALDGSGGGHGEKGEGHPERFGERRCLPEELPAVLGRFLRESLAKIGEDSGLLGLFNHARGQNGAEVMLPFRFSLDSVEFEGNLRILFPSIAGGSGKLEARFKASHEGSKGHDWSFDLYFGGLEAPALALFPNSLEKEARRRLPDLVGSLAESGCAVRLAGQSAEPGAMLAELDTDA